MVGAQAVADVGHALLEVDVLLDEVLFTAPFWMM
jgi:hypothetical protein